MDRIASFRVNHLRLTPGIYISRKDKVNEETVTTIDIRVKRPNFEDCMHPEVAHTIEHLGATYFRNIVKWKDKVIYFGPMGCLTGFYLVLAGDYYTNTSEYQSIIDLIMDMFRFVVKFKGNVPGASPIECGNYKMMNLDSARTLAANMLVLYETFDTLGFEYPDDNDVSVCTTIGAHSQKLPRLHQPDMSKYIGIEHNEFEDELKKEEIKKNSSKKEIKSEENRKNKKSQKTSKKKKSIYDFNANFFKPIHEKKSKPVSKNVEIKLNVLF